MDKKAWISESMARLVVARHLSAAPLDDYVSMKNPNPRYPKPSTVGWGLEKNFEYLEKATEFFKARKDSWAIIIRPDFVPWSAIEGYVRNYPKLKRSKIIVVSSSAMEGDYGSPEWVVIHDIIGHSIAYGSEKYDIVDVILPYIHRALPLKYQVNKMQKSDIEADILAGIFFHVDLQELIVGAAEGFMEAIESEVGSRQMRLKDTAIAYMGYEDDMDITPEMSRRIMSKIIHEMADDVALWTSRFKPGVPQEVTLW